MNIPSDVVYEIIEYLQVKIVPHHKYRLLQKKAHSWFLLQLNKQSSNGAYIISNFDDKYELYLPY